MSMFPIPDEILDTICERLANGESLRTICKDDDMPNQGQVFRRLAADSVFAEQYARAREAQAEFYADEIHDIADDGTNDWMEKHGKDGEATGWLLNGEAVARSRLRIDARKWTASKLLPKKYGDKQQVDHTNSDGSLGAFLAAVASGTGRVGGSDESA